MSRPLRIEYPGATYHISAFGNDEQDVFRSKHDRKKFLQILAQTTMRYNWICHGYCLMNDHYHLLIETPESNLSLGMRQVNGVYTQYFNRTHGTSGQIYHGRFKSILIEKETYLAELCRYIVLNPVRVKKVDKAGQWKWSSYNFTAKNTKSTENFVDTTWLLSNFDNKKKKARKKYRKFVETGIFEFSPLLATRTQHILGSDAFFDSVQQYVPTSNNNKKCAKKQHSTQRPALVTLFKGVSLADKEKRNDVIHVAHIQHGYLLKEIATFLNLHYTTVSKIINNPK